MGAKQLTTLVVGGAGFIGSRLVELLVANSAREVWVLGRSALPRQALPDGVRYIQGDASDSRCMQALLATCDEVIDLAYATVPKSSFDDPVHDLMSNLPPTVNLLQEACRHRLRRFLLVSSGGTVYGPAFSLPITESHPTNPISPYGITKLALEKYALMFHRLEGLPVVIARPGNPFGPAQVGNQGQGFIGAAIWATLRRQPVCIFGERGTVRDYLHVDDLAEGLLAALDHGAIGATYNIGTGQGLDNREVLDQLMPLAQAANYEIALKHLPARVFDVSANVLCSASLTELSGWRPRQSFSSALARTWEAALRAGSAA